MTQRRQAEIAKTRQHITDCEQRGIYREHPHCRAADDDRLAAIEAGEPYYDYDAQEWVEE